MNMKRVYWTTVYHGAFIRYVETCAVSYRRTTYYGLTPEEAADKVRLAKRGLLNSVSVNKKTGAVYIVKKLRKVVVRKDRDGNILYIRDFIPAFKETNYG